MEFPDEWLAYDKVPRDLRDMLKARNSKKEVQKRINSTSDKVSDSTIFKNQQNEVQEKIFIFHLNMHLSYVSIICFLSTLGCTMQTEEATNI